VVGWVVRHGATALIQDSLKDARYKATGPQRRAKTVLAAPLRAQDNLLGAMVLVRSSKEPFGAEHQRLVEAIASQAAVAIDHARWFETERVSRRRAEALLATSQAGSEAQALAAVPVRWQDRVIATLIVGFADPERLTAPELELLEEIGRQVALGMERLRLQARVQEQQNEMAVVAERNRIARDM